MQSHAFMRFWLAAQERRRTDERLADKKLCDTGLNISDPRDEKTAILVADL
jgi:hypothetical protein